MVQTKVFYILVVSDVTRDLESIVERIVSRVSDKYLSHRLQSDVFSRSLMQTIEKQDDPYSVKIVISIRLDSNDQESPISSEVRITNFHRASRYMLKETQSRMSDQLTGGLHFEMGPVVQFRSAWIFRRGAL